MSDIFQGTFGTPAAVVGAQGESLPPFRMLTGLLDALPAAIYSADAQGRLQFYNKAAAELWGVRPQLGTQEWCGSWRLRWPDGRHIPHHECPMAIASKEGSAIHGTEVLVERPDGTLIPFLAYPTPLYDSAGAVIGAVNMLVDIGDRKSAAYVEQLLASIVESSHDAIVSKDLNGTITTWNESAEQLFGYKPEEIIGKHVTTLIPEDRHTEETDIIERIRRGERVTHFETQRRRKDGSLVHVSLTISPVRNAAGTIVGASKIARDITEQKRAREQQALLLGEMSHRVKNVLAVAGGLVALSARSVETPQQMAKAVQERLAAYARAHELTRPGIIDADATVNRQTTLHALIHAILEPYAGPASSASSGEVAIEGEDVPIAGDTVTNLALVLHEFATNAAKYGALSSPGGRLHIRCIVENGNLVLQWEERGGPALGGPPHRLGFGSQFTRRTITGQLKGDLNHDWRPEGVVMTMTVPVERLAQTSA